MRGISCNILEIKNISKSFLGVKALDGVSFSVPMGEVHGLIGENGAGKSTLMNVIAGILRPESGTIVFDGRASLFKAPSESSAAGIAMILQETNLIPTFSVAENIWLGHESAFLRHGVLQVQKRDEAARELLRDIGCELPINESIEHLNIAQMQMVEIARALSCSAKLIIMDEPTSSLAEKEIRFLFGLIRRLRAQGITVIFISHKIEELFEICDRITVLRDGRHIATKSISEFSKDSLIRLVIGRELSDQYMSINSIPEQTVLKVDRLRGDKFRDISFEVHSGEIVGLYGLMGAGRSEIANAIFGIDRLHGGEIEFLEQKVRIRTPEEAVKLGMAMVTEDRLRMGIFAGQPVADNVSISSLRRFAGAVGYIDRASEEKEIQSSTRQTDLKAASLSMPVSSLSGGNQQKAIISRWLMTNPRFLIVDEPTRGIDVGAKSEIYKVLGKLVEEGLGVLLISSELLEVLNLCSRILVIRDGQLVFECSKKDATQELLGKYALG